jgi:hypothetical protein
MLPVFDPVDKLQDKICLVGGKIVRIGIFSKKTWMYKQFFHIDSIISRYAGPACWLTSILKLDKKLQEPTIFTGFCHWLRADYPQIFHSR